VCSNIIRTRGCLFLRSLLGRYCGQNPVEQRGCRHCRCGMEEVSVVMGHGPGQTLSEKLVPAPKPGLLGCRKSRSTQERWQQKRQRRRARAWQRSEPRHLLARRWGLSCARSPSWAGGFVLRGLFQQIHTGHSIKNINGQTE